MPEMPEVATAAKYINNDVKNQKILDSNFLIPKMVRGLNTKDFSNAINGETIKNVGNIGKHIIFELSSNKIMISHLRMEGKYRFDKILSLTKHDHAWFKFKKGFLIFSDTRKFGTYDLKTRDTFISTDPIKKLGFLAEDIDVKYFFNKLKNKKIAIKSSLLDQTIIVGLGNIYVDEVLWDAKINPEIPCNKITLIQAELILKTTEKILKKATKYQGSSINTYLAYNQIKGTYQKYLNVHTKAKEPCPRCQTPISKIKVNGRGTYFCTKCQK